MISVDKALELLLKNVAPVCDVEPIPLQQALSRVLASPIIAPTNVPPADNSAMDGYAVKAATISTGKAYPISQRIAAGSIAQPLAENTVARIFTGAEIPQGADAIIIQEDAQQQGDTVTFSQPATAMDNIRVQGQDLTQGSCILEPGIRLRPQELGLLASCGISEVAVYKKLRLAIISTGDELVDLGTELQPGQIYNSNRYLLNALCQQAGFDLVDISSLADDLEETKKGLISVASKADLIFTTGGVSVGDEDHVKAAVKATGHIDLWKIAIKPGKPLAFGKVGETDFIGLPGNPSSVFTTFLILALPRLKAMQGIVPDANRLIEKHQALFDRPTVTRREYLRARRTESGVNIFPNQSSGVLSSACWGDGFAVQYEGTEVRQGQDIEFIPYQRLY